MSSCGMGTSRSAILTRRACVRPHGIHSHSKNHRVNDSHITRSSREPQTMQAPTSAPLFWKTHISRRMNLPYAIETCVSQILTKKEPATDKMTGSPELLAAAADTSASDSIQADPASGVKPTLAIVFVSSAYADSYSQLVPLLREQVPSLTTIVGCSGYGVAGVSESGSAVEVENSPALSLTLACLPKVEVIARHVSSTQLPDGDAGPDQWSNLIGVPAFPDLDLSLIVLAEPNFEELGDLLSGLDYAFPDAAKIGGTSSAGAMRGATATFCWQLGSSEAPEPSPSPSITELSATSSSTSASAAEVAPDPPQPSASQDTDSAEPGSMPSRSVQSELSSAPNSDDGTSSPVAGPGSSSDDKDGSSSGSSGSQASRGFVSLPSVSGSAGRIDVATSIGAGIAAAASIADAVAASKRNAAAAAAASAAAEAIVAAAAIDAANAAVAAATAAEETAAALVAAVVAAGAKDARQGGYTLPTMYRNGAVVLALHGGVAMELIIAQGCRALSSNTYTVDEIESNTITRLLDGQGKAIPPMAVFKKELSATLTSRNEEEIKAVLQNLVVGLTPEGLKTVLEAQDFLIRPILGFTKEEGMVVGDRVKLGQRLRFMVRDKKGAIEDMASHGTAYKRKQLMSLMGAGLETGGSTQKSEQPFGTLMFTCSGRGTGLYDAPSVDAQAVMSYIPVPVAGFQCNGEIGRVGNTTLLHGFTCAVGVLRQVKEEEQIENPEAAQ